jgi:hypothetical protein
MDNASSIIDGSIAIGGIIAALAVSAWPVMTSGSTPAVDSKTAEQAFRMPLKKGA